MSTQQNKRIIEEYNNKSILSRVVFSNPYLIGWVVGGVSRLFNNLSKNDDVNASVEVDSIFQNTLINGSAPIVGRIGNMLGVQTLLPISAPLAFVGFAFDALGKATGEPFGAIKAGYATARYAVPKKASSRPTPPSA